MRPCRQGLGRKEPHPGELRNAGHGVLPSASRRRLEKLGVSTRLRDYGIKKKDIPVIMKKSKGGSRNFNPIDHSDKTVARMLIF